MKSFKIPDSFMLLGRKITVEYSQEILMAYSNKGEAHYVSDKILRRQIEYDEATEAEPNYITVGEGETELPSGEPVDEGNDDEEQEV